MVCQRQPGAPEIQVFSNGPARPAAGVDDRGGAEHAGGAVELQQCARRAVGPLLAAEHQVQAHRLALRRAQRHRRFSGRAQGHIAANHVWRRIIV